MLDKKKYNPVRKEPSDTVDTIYCGENTEEYRNILNEDVFPYQTPLPRIRHTPEPPII